MDGNQSLDHQLTPFTDAWLSLEAAFEGAMAPELGGLWTLIHWTMVLFVCWKLGPLRVIEIQKASRLTYVALWLPSLVGALLGISGSSYLRVGS